MMTLLITAVMPFSALAKTRCAFHLHQAPATVTAEDHPPAVVAAATSWISGLDTSPELERRFRAQLEGRGIVVEDLTVADYVTKFILPKWQAWSSMNDAQKNAALGIELRKLSRGDQPSPTLFTGSSIDELSAGNASRMLRQLQDRYPLRHPISDEQREQAMRLADALDFNYIHSQSVASSGAPLVSPQLLAREGLKEKPESYHSQLVGTSAAVDFDLLLSDATGKHLLPLQVPRDSVRLRDDIANRHGFMLPRYNNTRELLALMGAWEPGALEDLLRYLRFSLPSTVQSVNDLLLYLELGEMETVFPYTALYERLTPLRVRLKNFLMTEADGAQFLRAAFQHFVLFQAKDNGQFHQLLAQMKDEGGADFVFRHHFLKWIGWPAGVALFVPGTVAPQHYSVIGRETRLTGVARTRNFEVPRPTSRVTVAGPPLDHSTMP